MDVNPPRQLTADDLGDYMARLTSSRDLDDLLLAKLGVMKFPGAALGLDAFSSEALIGRYRCGFEMKNHTMVFVGGLCSYIYMFDTVEQMDELRGEFGPNGIHEAYAIPSGLWEEIASILSGDIKDFRNVRKFP